MLTTALIAKTVAGVAVGGLATGATLLGVHHHAERAACERATLDQRATAWLALPDGLRADIQKAVDEPRGQRAHDLLRIRDDALAGRYGADVRAEAEQRQQRLQDCLGH